MKPNSCYLRPVNFIDSPQQHDGASARLAGTMLWFAAVELIQRDGANKTRSIVPVAECGALPDAAQSIFANLTSSRAPLQMGARTIRLDQPQVMGILNLTPDSFSDGGKLDDDPDAATAAGVALSAFGRCNPRYRRRVLHDPARLSSGKVTKSNASCRPSNGLRERARQSLSIRAKRL